MAKMYYNEQEAAEALGITAEELAVYIRDDKLRVFQDGAKKMFKTEDVDALSGGGGEDEIELSPADSTADQISLSEADKAGTEDEKEDTVLTAEGISIFDDGELEIEVADPMAKTQIAPSLEEQMAIDGVGSGSGLLDLTRESDDTSLGAEVLGHIDMDEGVDAGLSGSVVGEAGSTVPPSPVPAPVVVVAAAADEMDATSGLFGGIVIGCTLVLIVIGAVVLAASRHAMPPYLKSMRNQVGLVVGAAVAVILIVAIIGMVIGKSAATKRSVNRSGGG